MDKYEIVKKIGEGAFGKVFLARGKEDNQQCVIKEVSLMKVSYHCFSITNVLLDHIPTLTGLVKECFLNMQLVGRSEICFALGRSEIYFALSACSAYYGNHTVVLSLGRLMREGEV